MPLGHEHASVLVCRKCSVSEVAERTGRAPGVQRRAARVRRERRVQLCAAQGYRPLWYAARLVTFQAAHPQAAAQGTCTPGASAASQIERPCISPYADRKAARPATHSFYTILGTILKAQGGGHSKLVGAAVRRAAREQAGLAAGVVLHRALRGAVAKPAPGPAAGPAAHV